MKCVRQYFQGNNKIWFILDAIYQGKPFDLYLPLSTELYSTAMHCIIPDHMNFLQRATKGRFFLNTELELTQSNNNKVLKNDRFQLKSENNESDFISTPNWI